MAKNEGVDGSIGPQAGRTEEQPPRVSDERRQLRMAAASEIAAQLQATKRFDPPPADEVDAWVWGVYDHEDEVGRVVKRGDSVWHRKDLSDEWHRLRFTEEGLP